MKNEQRIILGLHVGHDSGASLIQDGKILAAISEERDTIEDVLEPYLIQQGFIMRTPRGRVVTQYAYRHFGIKPSEQMEDLFSKGQPH